MSETDLHVGGVDGDGSLGLSKIFDPMVDPIVNFSDALVSQARDAVRSADDYVHDYPWAAIGVVGLIGLTAGFLLSRRI